MLKIREMLISRCQETTKRRNSSIHGHLINTENQNQQNRHKKTQLIFSNHASMFSQFLTIRQKLTRQIFTKTWRISTLIGPPSHFLTRGRRRKDKQEGGRSKDPTEDLTRKTSRSLDWGFDVQEHQPFKQSRNIHLTSSMILKAAGSRQKFQRRRGRPRMCGRTQGARKD